jgi:starch synthase (maltosyl-transferring)
MTLALEFNRMRDPTSVIIDRVTPIVDCGRHPTKRTVGRRYFVEADIFTYGPREVKAVIKWRHRNNDHFSETPMTLVNPGLDHWSGEFPLLENSRYVYTIEAWIDLYASWLADLKRRTQAKQPELTSELREGLELIQKAHHHAKPSTRSLLEKYMQQLRAATHSPPEALAIASSNELLENMTSLLPRMDVTHYSPALEVVVERPLARFGAWYELFVRSQGSDPGKTGTFKDAERRLHDIKKMGFDVVYLTPIHPIGHTNRKGRNNSLQAGPSDPGSPWAIGSAQGGHTAVEPSLGTLDDFDHFVKEAQVQGLEVAMDFAAQCSPDHPWVKDHLDWFYRRPDGTIKFAENPPKKYEDTYPIDFETADWKSLWEEMLQIALFWIGHGVKIFRVDNPHTKPLGFWRWFIDRIQSQHSEVIFLAEAFTRPAMMKALAKVGFSQSYTYFTWRNTKTEIVEYLRELSSSGMEEYFRPNFFTNTPDILPRVLQGAGRPAFKMRLVLAATLSPSYGVYSGFELCENEALPGTEEYKDSEKYQIRIRDWNRPGNIKEFIGRVNSIRKQNSALQDLTNLRFLPADNDQIIFYLKMTNDRSNIILVAVNLDPFHPQECTVEVPLDELGQPGGGFRVKDLLTGIIYDWTGRNYVRLDPQLEPAHILRVER